MLPSSLPPVTHGRRYAALVAGVLGLSLLSCGREVTGPEDGVYPSGRMAALALAPAFPALPGANLASDLVPFVKVRVLLLLPDGSVAKDTLVDFPSTADSISLVLSVQLPRSAPDSGVTLGLSMAYVNTAGDTVFRGGPLPVTARLAGSPGASQPISIPITWVPPGPVPVSVTMSPDTGSAVAGSATVFTAVARDAQGSVIAGTPVAFSSVDTTRAVTGAPGSGLVTWRARRGPALIVATLLNGPADTSTFQVLLPAALLLVDSGDGQSATVNTTLGQPITLRVTASDSVPVAGVPVTFAVTSGGGALSATADTSDANGLVSFAWTLGSVVGAQSVSAAAPGIATATRVVTATGTAPPPTQLAITAAPTVAVAGAPFAPVTIEARDAAGVLTPLFTGPVSVALDTATAAGATLAGTTTVNAVAGIATFTGLSVTRASTGLSLVATSGTLTPDTSAALDISAAAAAQLASVSGSGQSGAVLTTLAAPYVVRVADAFGNPVSGTAVRWAVTSGAGSLSTDSTVTDAAGEASTTLTLGGTLGAVTVAATAVGLSGSPQSFTATTTAGAPTQLFFSQSITSATAGSVNEWVVQVRDAAGNVATDFNGPVSVALIDGPPTAVLGGTTTVNAVNGFATFSTLTVDLAATTYRLVASSAGLPDAQSAVLTITPAAPATLVLIAGGAQTATVATPLADSLAFRLTDAFGNRIVSQAIDLTVEQGGGSVSPATGATDAAGEFRSAWTLGAAPGAQQVRATVTAAPAVQVTASATAIAGVAAQLAITSGPIGAQVAGVPLPDLVVEGRDAVNNLATGFAGQVIARAEQAGVVIDSAQTLAVSGVATFSGVALVTAGTYSVRYSSAGLTDAVSDTFVVTAAAAAQLNPESATTLSGFAGLQIPVPIQVRVEDAFLNRVAGTSVDFVYVRGVDTLSLASVVSDASGIASFQPVLALTPGGSQVIATAPGLANSPLVFTVNVFVGPAVELRMVAQPVATTAGATMAPLSVEATDQFGNRRGSFTLGVTVVVDSGPAGAVLSGTTTVNAVSGLATFSTLSVDLAGTYRFRFLADSLTDAVSTGVVISAGAATQLVLTTDAAGAASGTAFTTQPVVEVRDAQGNLVTTDNSTLVTLTVDGSGTVVGTDTATAVGGVATFAAAGLGGPAGAYTLTFSGGELTAATQGITLTAGTATQLVLTTAAAGAVAGVSFTTQPVVEIRDASGNLVTTDSSTLVTLVVDGGGTVVGTDTATAVGGVATFAAAGLGGTAGAYTLTFSSGALAVATQGITLTVGTAAQLAVATPAAGAASGVAFTTQPVVEIRDASGNLVTTDSSTLVTLTVDGSGTVVGTDTATAVGGVATFAAAGLSGTAGAYTLTFGSGALAAATQGITLTVGTAAQLAVATPAAGAASGTAFTTQPVVEIRDASGNLVTTDNSTLVTLTVDGSGTVVGTDTATAVGGVATFAAAGLGGTAGAYTLTFSGGELTVATQPIAVSAGAAIALIISTPAAGAVNGGAFTTQPVVAVVDTYSNVVTSDSSTVVTVSFTGDILTGTITATAVAGIATFTDLGISGLAGTFDLNFSSQPLEFASQSIALGPGEATTLSLDGEIGGFVVAGDTLSLISIAALDTYGNIRSAFTDTITATIDIGTVGAVLSGTTATSAVAGTAIFDDLSLDLVGTYRLRFSSPGLANAVTGLFEITSAAPASVIVVAGDAQTGTVSALLNDSITVRLRDAFNNPIADTTVDFFVGPGSGSTSPTVAATNAAGEASTAWTLGSLVGTQQMIVTVPGYEGVQVTVSATAQSPSAPLVQWTGGGVNNNWDNVANWDLRVPLPADSVVINVTDTVNVATTATVGWLVVGESSSPLFTIGAGATLAVDSLAVFGSTSSVNMTGGTLTGGGSVSILGTLTWSGGTMSGAGSTLIASSATATITGAPTLNTRTFTVAGAATLGGTAFNGSNVVGQTPTLAVLAGGTLEFTSTTSYFSGNGVVDLVNAGTLRKAASAGLVRVDWPITNTGIIEVADDSLDLRNALNHEDGSLAILPGAALLHGGETRANAAITIGTGGRLQLQSGGISTDAGNHIFTPGSSITGLGRLMINSADTTRIQGGLDIDSLTVLNGNTWFESADTMFVTRGAYLGGGFFRGSGVLGIRGAFALNPGNVVGTGGTMSVRPTGTLTLRGMSGWNVDVAGTAIWGDYDMTFTQDTLNGVPYASLRVRSGGLLDVQHSTTTPRELFALGSATYPNVVFTIDAGATVRKTTGSGVSNFRPRFEMAGTFDVLSGSINIQGTCAMTGNKTGAGSVTGNCGSFP